MTKEGCITPVGGEVHGGKALGDQVDGEVDTVHPEVADKVTGLVHALNLSHEKIGFIGFQEKKKEIKIIW